MVPRIRRGPKRIQGTVRGRGRKPEGKCKTGKFTEGSVKHRRGIFRKLKNIIISEYSMLRRGDPTSKLV